MLHYHTTSAGKELAISASGLSMKPIVFLGNL